MKRILSVLLLRGFSAVVMATIWVVIVVGYMLIGHWLAWEDYQLTNPTTLKW